jgi:hypothetical protein
MKSELFKYYINLYCQEFIAKVDGSGFILEKDHSRVVKLDSSMSKAWTLLDQKYIDRIIFVAPWLVDVQEICNIFNMRELYDPAGGYHKCTVYISLDINCGYGKNYFLEEFTISDTHFPFLMLFGDNFANTVGLCINTDCKSVRVCIKGSEVSAELYQIPKHLYNNACNSYSNDMSEESVVLLDMEWQELSKRFYEQRNDILTKKLSVFEVFV